MNKLYQVVDDSDILIVYLSTTNKRLATKTLREVKKSDQKYANYKIITTEITHLPPLFGWLFFRTEDDEWDICVEEPGTDFQASWADTECYVIHAYTLKEAKKILKKEYGVICE